MRTFSCHHDAHSKAVISIFLPPRASLSFRLFEKNKALVNTYVSLDLKGFLSDYEEFK